MFDKRKLWHFTWPPVSKQLRTNDIVSWNDIFIMYTRVRLLMYHLKRKPAIHLVLPLVVLLILKYQVELINYMLFITGWDRSNG